MKRLLFIFLCIPVLGFSQYTAIPDPNFEQALIALGYDNSSDGQVLTANINTIDSLSISGLNITNLTGLQDFQMLHYLDCSFNQISSFDVLSTTIYINYLDISYNSLNSLTIGQNYSLEYLYCNNNQLTQVFPSNIVVEMNCSNNQLTNFNSQFTNGTLTYLNISDNQIVSLNLNEELTFLDCSSNMISNLNLSPCQNLTTLDCSTNELSSLDISGNATLTTLDCSTNELLSLDVKNGNNMNFMYYNSIDNDSLYCITVDDSAWSTDNWLSVDNFAIFSNDCNSLSTNFNEYHSNTSFFPNPTNNLIQIEIKNYNGSFEAALYDFTGKLLETTNSTKLSLVDYPKGIYLLKVSYGDRIEEVKVVKE